MSEIIAKTRNSEYNDLLEKWAAAGYPCNSECEECGKDLSGQEVFDIEYLWVCSCCKEKIDNKDPVLIWREDFEKGKYISDGPGNF